MKIPNSRAAKGSVFRTYYQLTKPGIIYGNLVYATAGFLLAADGHINLGLLVETLAGIALVIASACVFNNYIDREIDKNMARTKRRALVLGTISEYRALSYASLLGILGFSILVVYTNGLTVAAGAVGMFFYLAMYGYSKRRTIYGTLVGAVAGAMPPVAGYLAVANQLDPAAVVLFLVLVFWQMVHFYSIAIYRFDDYKNAKLPVLPVVKGTEIAKLNILFYSIGFVMLASLLTLFNYTGKLYLVVMLGFGVYWIYLALVGFSASDEKKWARKMFFYSLIVTLVFSFMLSVNHWLP